MSDSEEENYCFFGKPLAPYDEDSFPKKKPISVEDQIATDAQGRRRFHGAFTGGFSAGFYNTVGSLEGWTPSEFKSTRKDKATAQPQKPEDFMDAEDLGQFGIAPQTVRATSDYSTSKKRKRQVFSEGPIPGEPVLHSLLTSGNETIGYLLLKNIGLKGKNNESEERVYGCEMPKTYEISRDDEFCQYVIPDIYKEFLSKPKDNSFGLGYIGLDKSHVNLFKSSNLVIREHKKKISITGQAFGVGAFEDEDEDIYVKEDMSRYDFELTGEKTTKNKTPKEKTVFDDFVPSKDTLPQREIFTPPTIPHSFTGKHKVKRSRFEPLPAPETPERMNPEIRARQLGEEEEKSPNEGKKTEENPRKLLGLDFDRFVSASKPEDASNILETVEKSDCVHGTQEMRDAAKMKMFGPLTRITSDWQPCSLLCKRFNVPEPHFDELNASKSRKRTKNLIFEYEKFADVSLDLKPGLSLKEPETETVTEEKIVIIEEKNEVEEKTTAKDITEKIDVDKNMDLFKAVFLSSSESEDEEEKQDKTTEMKTTVLSDSFLPKIKPIKSGILSDVDFSRFDESKSTEIEETTSSQVQDPLSYGPMLPQKLVKSVPSTGEKPICDHSDEEWVEKPKKEKKHKEKKKNKDKKSSHKKKHKHSKDK